MATQFSEIVHNLTGLPKHFTEPKYYVSALRYVSLNHMVYISLHALISQAQSYIEQYYISSRRIFNCLIVGCRGSVAHLCVAVDVVCYSNR